MAYCTVNFIRTVSGLESEEIDDPTLRDLRDEVAIPEMNDDLNVDVSDQQIFRINAEKKNQLNDSNTTFYLPDLHRNHKVLGDYNDDGEVTDDDVTGYYLDRDNNRGSINITVVDQDTGQLTITDSSGNPLPEGSKLFISYAVAPADESTPHPMVKVACAQLTAAYAFTNIEAAKLKNFSIGDVTIRKQSQGFSIMKNQYRDTVDRIVQRDLIEFGDNVDEIEDVFTTPFRRRPD